MRCRKFSAQIHILLPVPLEAQTSCKMIQNQDRYHFQYFLPSYGSPARLMLLIVVQLFLILLVYAVAVLQLWASPLFHSFVVQFCFNSSQSEP